MGRRRLLTPPQSVRTCQQSWPLRERRIVFRYPVTHPILVQNSITRYHSNFPVSITNHRQRNPRNTNHTNLQST